MSEGRYTDVVNDLYPRNSFAHLCVSWRLCVKN